jgi:acyl-CoA reductase-like NAD-dependent aldehyde dehydrogenase
MRINVKKMFKLFIDGKFTRTESERYITFLNPKNKKTICNISRGSVKDIRNAVVAARNAQNKWASKTAYERGQILYRFAEMLESRKAQYIEELIETTGCNKAAAVKEVEYSIDRIIWYAGVSDKWVQMIGTVNSVQTGYFNFSIPEPTGVVGIILADEFPLLTFISRVCPIIVSGNTAVVIPSEKYPLTSLTLSEVIVSSDFPAGVINIISGYRKELVSTLSGHMDVNSIDLSYQDAEIKKLIKTNCANNVKRFNFVTKEQLGKIYKNEEFENIREIDKFIEIKTVWHTMGL